MTPNFDPVDLPSWDQTAGPQQTISQIDNWLGSPPMTALIAAFGDDLNSTDPAEFASRLREFASAQWDFRQGKERDTAERREFSVETSTLVSTAAEALGLTDARTPTRTHYDCVLVLGGLIRACIVRPRYAAHLMAHGRETVEIVGLGAFRELSAAELKLGQRLGVDASDEFDAMVAGMRRAFAERLEEPPALLGESDPENTARSWRVKTWSTHSSAASELRSVHVVAAPTQRAGAKRANTTETYDFWATRLRRPDIQSVLIVTNPIYVGYQGCGAIRTLGLTHGLDVETVGVSNELADLGDATQPFGTQEYLQEVLSTVTAMSELRGALATQNR